MAANEPNREDETLEQMWDTDPLTLAEETDFGYYPEGEPCEPMWVADPPTLEEEIAMGSQPDLGEYFHPEEISGEPVPTLPEPVFVEGEDESLWGPIPFLYDSKEVPPWEKTEWDRVDQLLGEAIINIIYTAEESQDIWDHKWLNNMRFNVEPLDTVVHC